MVSLGLWPLIYASNSHHNRHETWSLHSASLGRPGRFARRCRPCPGFQSPPFR